MGVGGWGWLSAESAGFWPGAGGYIAKVLGYSPIAYWPQNEASGATAVEQVNSPAQDGAYTGVTLGQTGIGDGETCPLYDGANDYTNIYTATFASAFDETEGTLSVWGKVSGSGVWTDGTERYFVTLRSGGDNQIYIVKTTANNTLELRYEAGGSIHRRVKGAVSETGWMHLALTWSVTADEVKLYYAGAQDGPTVTALGTWVGALSSTRVVIGARSTTPHGPWDGYVAHCAVWDSALGGAAIADLASV